MDISDVIESKHVRGLSFDLSTVSEINRAVEYVRGSYARHGRAVAADTFAVAVVADAQVRVAAAAISAGDVADLLGVSQGTVSQGARVVAACRFHATGAHVEGLSDGKAAKVVAGAVRLDGFWAAATVGTHREGSFRTVCEHLVGDDGARRGWAIGEMVAVFGSLSAAYKVAIGADGAGGADGGPAGDDASDGDVPDSRDSGPASGLDMIAKAILVAKDQGHTVSEIAAFVTRCLGS